MVKQLRLWSGLLLLLLLFGCGTGDSQSGDENTGSEKIADIDFEHVQFEEAPSSIRSAAEFKSRKEATFSLPGDDGAYIIVTRGEKPTGGYSVEITNVEEHSDAIVVSFKYHDPADDELVTQSLTYPLDIVKITKTDKQIKFKKIEHVNEKDEGLNIQL